VVNVDVLLLDDLGAWRMTDWMNDTLFYILNMRYLERRATLITTNYPESGKPEKEIDRRPKDDDSETPREHLIDRIGSRTRSRILEMCGIIRLPGDDRRQKLNEGPIEGILR
jgi:DNA replication protein DnaC